MTTSHLEKNNKTWNILYLGASILILDVSRTVPQNLFGSRQVTKDFERHDSWPGIVKTKYERCDVYLQWKHVKKLEGEFLDPKMKVFIYW